MKKIIFTFLILFGAITLFASKGFEVTYQQTGQSTSELYFEIGDFQVDEVIIDGVTYNKILYDGSVHTEKKGFAELAYVHATVMLSPNKNFEINVIGGDYTDYSLEYPLLPSRGVIYRDQDPSQIPYLIDPTSIVDAWYPTDVAQSTEPFIIKDIRGTSVFVYPFQYNAAKNILRVYHNVRVQLIENESQPVINQLTNITDNILYEMSSVYRSVFINYENNRDDLTIGDFGEILVICTDRDSEAIDPYIEWKIQKGLKVYKEVVATGTLVKSLVQEKYDENNNILYVMLIGDWADIKSETLGSSPMDPQLGCVVGSDVYADICVGRFSASSPSDVTIQVEKVINYEQNPEAGATWYSHALAVASNQGASNGDDGEIDYEHNDIIYENKLEPFTYDEFTTVYDPGANSTAVKNAVEEGVSVINYTGHGSPTSWGTSGFSNSNVATLVNAEKLPVVISVACNNGDFHTGECFAEAWAKKEGGGSIMFLGATISQPWAPPMRGQDYFMDIMTGGYDYELYPDQNGISTFEGRSTVGSFIFNGLTLMIVESSGSDDLKTAKTWTMFGDPSLQMRTATPSEITLNNDVILMGIPFTTTVTSAGQPVVGALVAISQGDLMFAALTDETGSVSIENTLEPGEATLVLTGFNLQTIFMEATVIPPDGPYIILVGCVINDDSGNGNNEADYGEDITLDFTLKNVGIETAEEVTAYIQSDDIYVTLNTTEYFYGDILQEESIGGSDFSISISDDVPDMHVIVFDIEIIDANDSTWTTTYMMPVNAPLLDIAFDHIDDTEGDNNGRLDPGETADIIFNGLNIGHADSPGATMTISTSSEFLTLNNSSADLGIIEVEGSNPGIFNATVSEETPVGTVIELLLTLTAGDYYTEIQTSLTVGLILEDWETADFGDYEWEFGGNADWFITDILPYEGNYCTRSGDINDQQSSELLITLEVLTDGQISFFKKVSSEPGYDYLEFYIDNTKLDSWAGTINWSEESFDITAGTHMVKWVYDKDMYVSSNQDCAWLDYIIFPAIALPVSVNTITRAANEVKAFPNPFDDIVYISYSVEKASDVMLSVFNSLGQKMTTIDNGMMQPGNYTFMIKTTNYEKGIYFFQLKIDDQLKNGKIIRSE